MRLLLDENIPKIIVDHLKTLHIDLRTAQDLNLKQAPDSEILRRSNRAKRIIVTRDLGLISSYPNATKYGLILIRYKGLVSKILLSVLTDFISYWKKKSLKDKSVVIDEEKYEVFKINTP